MRISDRALQLLGGGTWGRGAHMRARAGAQVKRQNMTPTSTELEVIGPGHLVVVRSINIIRGYRRDGGYASRTYAPWLADANHSKLVIIQTITHTTCRFMV